MALIIISILGLIGFILWKIKIKPFRGRVRFIGEGLSLIPWPLR